MSPTASIPLAALGQFPQPVPPLKKFRLPNAGERIISQVSGNEYVIGLEIGRGSFGVVFDCLDVWGNELAAKVLMPNNMSYEQVKARAETEVTRLQTFRHPTITHVFEAFEYKDTFYLVTERCFNPLHQLFTIPGYDWQVWLKPVARCLLQALHFLHTYQVIHKDVHLGNVFSAWHRDEVLRDLRSSDHSVMTFKLGDLGNSNFIQNVDLAHTLLAQWMLPPEVIDPGQFGQYDHRADIYHAGLLFLHLAYGKQLDFSKDEIVAGAPRQMAEQLPQPYGQAIGAALRRHVQSRVSTALDLWKMLRAAPARLTLLRGAKS